MTDLAYVPMGIAIIAIVFVILIFCIGDADGISSVAGMSDDGDSAHRDSCVHRDGNF